MPNKILALVPSDFDAGFKLAGVDTKTCASATEAKECLEKQMFNTKYTLILIDEDYLLSFDARFNKRIQETMLPLVMGIPLKKSFKEEAMRKDYFIKMIQGAIGYEIRVK